MGNTLIAPITSSSSSSASTHVEASTLLDASLNGELHLVKKQVGYFLATILDRTSEDPAPDVRLKAFVNHQDANGNAAMHAAAFGGHVEVIQFLHIMCGASLELKNHLGCSPLWLTAGYNRLDAFDCIWQLLLLNKQQTSKASSITSTTTTKPAEEDCLQLPLLTMNSTGDSILLAAASRGHVDMVQQILRVANSKTVVRLKCQTNQSGDTPLNVAMAGDFHENDTLMNLLMEPSIVHVANRKGVSPILMCCERDWPLLLQRLLDAQQQQLEQVNAESTFTSNDTPQPPQQLLSPLAMAAFCGSEHVLEMLIKRYQQQDPILLPQLLNSPSDGATPLWLAARAGHTSCVKLLLEAGADASIPNRKGVTPLDVAIQRKRTEIINLLQDKPAPKS